MPTPTNMTFEQYMRRPVYVAQVKTATLATEMGVLNYKLRLVPAYRTAEVRDIRKAVADKARAMRKAREAFPWPADDHRAAPAGTRAPIKPAVLA